MKMIFKGHDARYAVEQSLLAFFPQERPVYDDPEDREGNWASVSLSQGGKYATAVTTISYWGCMKQGISRVALDAAADEYERERLRQERAAEGKSEEGEADGEEKEKKKRRRRRKKRFDRSKFPKAEKAASDKEKADK